MKLQPESLRVLSHLTQLGCWSFWLFTLIRTKITGVKPPSNHQKAGPWSDLTKDLDRMEPWLSLWWAGKHFSDFQTKYRKEAIVIYGNQEREKRVPEAHKKFFHWNVIRQHEMATLSRYLAKGFWPLIPERSKWCHFVAELSTYRWSTFRLSRSLKRSNAFLTFL